MGALILLLPVGPRPALAETGWVSQELTSADRIGLVLDAGSLRVGEAGADNGASLRKDQGARAVGLATFPEHRLDRATDTIDVRVGSAGDPEDVLAEVRGVRVDGMWTEWHPAPERGGRVTLSDDVTRVQLRVGIDGADTAVTELGVRLPEGTGDMPSAGLPDDLAPQHGPRPDGEGGGGDEGSGENDGGDPPESGVGQGDDIPERPFSARLFATRIGLVGGTTANGHIIRPDDHFVALPSRRGLATRGGGEYTVRVCTTGELGPEGKGDTEGHTPRCAYLPVWDVGPWNITDDHWNADRQSWRDLDRGRPQAQAAYAQGHNGGLDGFGRRVRNPAGIDLADGAFNAGLQLPTNGWVQVDYLWTGEYRHRTEIGTATRRDPVVLRSGPGPEHPTVGLAAHKANIDVICTVTGASATGPQGTDDTWYRIGEDHYVPAVFADGGGDAPVCAEPVEPVEPTEPGDPVEAAGPAEPEGF
ncbi:hypothetical protein [Nocardiopsis lambiniae]|uniref:SH3 domain-containing protein n=1 Tax=Nocardiopsis lambiniae TaxID=3075539 RepID=A0ABU2M5M0_9ACTN|nr:hypothetical protein [Nocardiopsis sp. DSM 44743]MDT0327944.1 hypothetical protein [Nocardiopsis sp. DSM 44743]